MLGQYIECIPQQSIFSHPAVVLNPKEYVWSLSGRSSKAERFVEENATPQRSSLFSPLPQ